MQTGNILFGFNLATAYVKIGAYGAAEVASADVGRTEGGVEFKIEREMKHVETDQDPGPVGAKEVKRIGKLKLNLAEATLENLAVAMNLATTAVAASKLSIGAPASGENYVVIYLNTDGPSGGTRKYTLYKCVCIGSASHAIKKDDKTFVECEFDVLWDTTQAAGEEMGMVEDSGADTTPPTVALSTPVDGGTVTQGAKGTVTWEITETNRIDQSTMKQFLNQLY